MKILFSTLLFASSVGWAEALPSTQNVNPNNGVVDANYRGGMSCKPMLYNCGDHWEEADLCEDGSLYLRGTDIPFRCDRYNGGG